MFDLTNVVTKAMNEALDSLKKGVDSLTPEDTKTLLGNNKIQAVIKSGDVYHGRVYNDTPYAQYVEYGVRGKKFKYRKPKGNVFYTGVGARMYARTQMEKEKLVIAKIESEIEKAIVLFNNDKGTKLI